jgi:hypothetical protein
MHSFAASFASPYNRAFSAPLELSSRCYSKACWEVTFAVVKWVLLSVKAPHLEVVNRSFRP